MILLTIFNETSGRCLEDWKTGGYLTFPTKWHAKSYIRKNNLNKKVFKLVNVVMGEVQK